VSVARVVEAHPALPALICPIVTYKRERVRVMIMRDEGERRESGNENERGERRERESRESREERLCRSRSSSKVVTKGSMQHQSIPPKPERRTRKPESILSPPQPPPSSQSPEHYRESRSSPEEALGSNLWERISLSKSESDISDYKLETRQDVKRCID
jgi:hypothetical protein